MQPRRYRNWNPSLFTINSNFLSIGKGLPLGLIISGFLSRALHDSYAMPGEDFVDRFHTNITDS